MTPFTDLLDLRCDESLIAFCFKSTFCILERFATLFVKLSCSRMIGDLPENFGYLGADFAISSTFFQFFYWIDEFLSSRVSSHLTAGLRCSRRGASALLLVLRRE